MTTQIERRGENRCTDINTCRFYYKGLSKRGTHAVETGKVLNNEVFAVVQLPNHVLVMTFCNPVDCRMLHLPVLHSLLVFAQNIRLSPS